MKTCLDIPIVQLSLMIMNDANYNNDNNNNNKNSEDLKRQTEHGSIPNFM